MKKVSIKNISKNNMIAERGYMADSFLTRLSGLIGKKNLSFGEALCIKPCKAVHTFFMRFDIDVIFVDEKNKVCKIIKSLKPWKISGYVNKAIYVIETTSNQCEKKGVEVGDEIEVKFIKVHK